MQNRPEDLFQEGMEVIAQGHAIEEFLAQHRGVAPELEPLLHLAGQLHEALAAEPRPEAKATTRFRVLAYAQEHPSNLHGWFAPLLALPRATVALAIAMLLLSASSVTLVASASALPGEPLYPIKTGWERARLTITWDEAERAMAHIHLASRRTEELAELSARGRPIPQEAVTTLTRQTSAATAGMEGSSDAALLSQRLLELTQRQQQVLTKVAAKAPEAAQPALQHALGVSRRGHQRAEEALEKERTHGEDRPPQRGTGPQGALSPTATPRGAREEHPEGEERQRGKDGEEKQRGRGNTGQERQPTPGATPSPTALPVGETREDEDARGSPQATPQPGGQGRRDGEGRERPSMTPTPEPGQAPTPPSEGRGGGHDQPQHQDEEDED